MKRSLALLFVVGSFHGLSACADPASGSSGAGGSTSVGGSTLTNGSTSSGGGDARPDKPLGMADYVTGEDADKDVSPAGPGVLLMGGGTDVDAAFQWWKPLLQGGDVVVLRASGADGYNSYLYDDIGGCDSVETMVVDTPELAASPYVVWTIRHAEGVFLAGGDQAKYLQLWKGTPVEDALRDAYARGAVIGGTSAGCAVLGEWMFAAKNDTVYSNEALADPYNKYMTMERDFVGMPLVLGVLTDTHFAQRDRMGRLVAFVARVVADGWSKEAVGIGVDEETAIVIGPDGAGQVVGAGAAYVVRTNGAPAKCEAGAPLEYAGLTLTKLVAGDALQFPGATTSKPGAPLSASGGVLSPADPY